MSFPIHEPGDLPTQQNGSQSRTEQYFREGDGLPGTGTLPVLITWWSKPEGRGIRVACSSAQRSRAAVEITEREYVGLASQWWP